MSDTGWKVLYGPPNRWARPTFATAEEAQAYGEHCARLRPDLHFCLAQVEHPPTHRWTGRAAAKLYTFGPPEPDPPNVRLFTKQPGPLAVPVFLPVP